jgi:hypothetical protein
MIVEMSSICAVLGKVNHFIFKALIFWEKEKVSLAFENLN